MSDEEATQILEENEWAKFADARELIQMVWEMGYKKALQDLKEKQ